MKNLEHNNQSKIAIDVQDVSNKRVHIFNRLNMFYGSYSYSSNALVKYLTFREVC